MVYEKIAEFAPIGLSELKDGIMLYWQWEMDFLIKVQEGHVGWLDAIMKFLSTIGDAGILWIVISVILAIIPKTRKCGFTMMLSMVLTLAIGNGILKNVISRFRPCWVYDLADIGKSMLIKVPTDYSFPSGHTMNGVTASVVIFIYSLKNKKAVPAGVAAIVLAGLIAFSRMYLFVHWPTDIMAGAVVGLIDAIISYFIMTKLVFPAVEKAIANKKAKKEQAN